MFDFRRITLFCLEKRLSKHKITIFSKNLRGAKAPLAPWLFLWSEDKKRTQSDTRHTFPKTIWRFWFVEANTEANTNTLYKNDILRCSYCIYCAFKLSAQFPWTDKIIRWFSLCGAHSRSFGGSVFKWRRNEQERIAKAVVTGSTYVSCRSFLTSEKMLQFEVNARVLETTSFIFTLTPTGVREGILLGGGKNLPWK